ncbi:hypothetical protein [Ruminococcus gauvreauii]|uniref:Uncharacterized protein n=1 Tax=Ruminococcus gauvreauii TaxID=438033 RepID=A0ABY5VJP9_9FIRM|nr:hypothetical protein [Ruminococcus gauvreauii]UWP60789.1 hypothetical protein NQ502_07065 [Ruminococcus gauvreauii]
MNKSQMAIMISKSIQIIQLICGCFITFLFGLTAIYSMFDMEKDGAGTIIIMWILTLIGAAIIFFGLKRKKILKEYKRYAAQLSTDPTGSIENLASASGSSQDEVYKNLNYMIKKKYFADAYIDKQKNRIVICSKRSGQYDKPLVNKNIEYTTVTCKNCGGINKIPKGQVCECEYCGSPIQ